MKHEKLFYGISAGIVNNGSNIQLSILFGMDKKNIKIQEVHKKEINLESPESVKRMVSFFTNLVQETISDQWKENPLTPFIFIYGWPESFLQDQLPKLNQQLEALYPKTIAKTNNLDSSDSLLGEVISDCLKIRENFKKKFIKISPGLFVSKEKTSNEKMIELEGKYEKALKNLAILANQGDEYSLNFLSLQAKEMAKTLAERHETANKQKDKRPIALYIAQHLPDIFLRVVKEKLSGDIYKKILEIFESTFIEWAKPCVNICVKSSYEEKNPAFSDICATAIANHIDMAENGEIKPSIVFAKQ